MARVTAVISSPDLGVVAVAAEGVLCAFCCVLDPLSEHCRRRRARVNPLVVAVFRTKQLLRERCAATCLRRRRPGQARRRQGGLQITAQLGGQAASLLIGSGEPIRSLCALRSTKSADDSASSERMLMRDRMAMLTHYVSTK